MTSDVGKWDRLRLESIRSQAASCHLRFTCKPAPACAKLEWELRERAKRDGTARRLMTISGIGAIGATALEGLAPPAETFAKSRDFAAWLRLTPRQNSSGGKVRLGSKTKKGQRDLRRLLICGAVTVVRWALRKSAAAGSWLAAMLARKPRLVLWRTLKGDPQ